MQVCNNRRKELRAMKKLFLGLTIVLALNLSVTASVFASEYYVVKQGDSLWSIAKRNGTTVERIASLNNLTSDKLQIGDKLLLPSATSTSSAPARKEPISRGNTVSASSEAYIVEKGDSLWSIARRYGMTVKELMEINGLTSDKIRPGDKLLLRRSANNTVASSSDVQSLRRQVLPARSLEADAAWARGIIGTAKQYLGAPYRYGGTAPSGFDCSGFVMYVFGQHGMSLPHSSRAQFDTGVPVDRSELSPGDLVFFMTGGSSRINHVGIYIGDGSFIHASTNKGITITSLADDTYASQYVGARRVSP